MQPQHPTPLLLNRRELLRAAAVAAGGLALVSLLPACSGLEPELNFAGQRLRGTADGRILISQDDGQTWQQAITFGGHFAVRRLSKSRGQAVAHLEFQGLDLTLKSDDGRTWYTSAYDYPG